MSHRRQCMLTPLLGHFSMPQPVPVMTATERTAAPDALTLYDAALRQQRAISATQREQDGELAPVYVTVRVVLEM